MEIEAARLTTYDVAPDGTRFRLGFADADGRALLLSLPTECLPQLLITVPRIASQALRARYRDSSLRVVYPATEWRVERADDCQVILTLGPGDGFEVSFAMCPDVLTEMADAASSATVDPAKLS